MLANIKINANRKLFFSEYNCFNNRNAIKVAKKSIKPLNRSSPFTSKILKNGAAKRGYAKDFA